MTGMTLALLLKTTNGTLTYRIALLLKFILINPKNATMKSSTVSDWVKPPAEPLNKIIVADITTAMAY